MKYLKPFLLLAVVVMVVFNQVQLTRAATMLGHKTMMASLMDSLSIFGSTSTASSLAGGEDLKDVDLGQIQSTAQGLAAIFALAENKSAEKIMAMMLPKGTPAYGQAMGVSFDDAVGSLATLAKAQKPLLAGLTPEQKTRFINLASQPLGISCEYCCSVQAIGINKEGDSICGCQHNPALLSVTMWLMQNTDYSDAEILREVYKWKTLFFPKDMIELATKIAGGDGSVLETLPGMVGGC